MAGQEEYCPGQIHRENLDNSSIWSPRKHPLPYIGLLLVMIGTIVAHYLGQKLTSENSDPMDDSYNARLQNNTAPNAFYD